MKKEQRICVLLAIMILGIWGLEAKSSGSLIPKSWKIRMIQSVQENAERLYMPGVTYTEKKQGEIRVTEAVVHMASSLIPLGNYVTEREAAELLTEDEATYAILAKKQKKKIRWMKMDSLSGKTKVKRQGRCLYRRWIFRWSG